MPQSLKDQYRDVISARDYRYYDTYAPEDQDRIIDEAIRSLHEQNVASMKACVRTDDPTQLLGLISHVRTGLKWQQSSSCSLQQELRTPLNGIVAILDLMQSDAMTPDQRLYLGSLEQSSMYLHLVVNRLQDIAALCYGEVALNYMPFDLVAVITGAAESLQHYSSFIGKGSKLTLELDPQLPLSLNGDMTKVSALLVSHHCRQPNTQTRSSKLSKIWLFLRLLGARTTTPLCRLLW
jgi:signal transduction histidine kinase